MCLLDVAEYFAKNLGFIQFNTITLHGPSLPHKVMTSFQQEVNKSRDRGKNGYCSFFDHAAIL